MIPVGSLQDVLVHWVRIALEGYILHGFLIYTPSDNFFPQYIEGEGLTDLDMWSGPECGIFLLHDPPDEWVEYARARDHIWWRVYGTPQPKLPQWTETLAETPLVEVGDGDKLATLRQTFLPVSNRGLAKHQAACILAHFNLGPTQHPCFVFFRKPEDRHVWLVKLDDLLGLDPNNLRRSLQVWFGGAEFRRLLEEARNA